MGVSLDDVLQRFADVVVLIGVAVKIVLKFVDETCELIHEIVKLSRLILWHRPRLREIVSNAGNPIVDELYVEFHPFGRPVREFPDLICFRLSQRRAFALRGQIGTCKDSAQQE